MDSTQLDAVIAEFLQAEAAGQNPAPQVWLERHPELFDDLAAFFANRAKMVRMVAPLRQASTEADTVPPTGDWQPLAEAPTVAPGHVPPTAEPSKGRYFGDHELLEEIARGGMGVVFKARQASLNRIVALKMILTGHLASQEDKQRFRVEVEAAAHLDHPHIVPIHEVGEHHGQPCFSMKFMEGGSLAGQLQKTPAVRNLITLLTTVCHAVHHAHQRGILHRDLKPGNILLDKSGQPHVTDFGLAKKVEGDSGMTRTGVIVGTPSYMAPEQAAAKKQLTTAVDIYALGAILYEILTGRPPFQEATPLDTLLQVLDQEPVPPHQLNPAADRDLETIALKCLEKEPEKRYGSAQALAEELERWLQGEPIRARPVSPWEYGLKWVKRNPSTAQMGGVCLFLAAAALASLLRANALLVASLLTMAWFSLLYFPLRWLARRRDENEWRGYAEATLRSEPVSVATALYKSTLWRSSLDWVVSVTCMAALVLSVFPTVFLLAKLVPYEVSSSIVGNSILWTLAVIGLGLLLIGAVIFWHLQHFRTARQQPDAATVGRVALEKWASRLDHRMLFRHWLMGSILGLLAADRLYDGLPWHVSTDHLGWFAFCMFFVGLLGLLYGSALLAFRPAVRVHIAVLVTFGIAFYFLPLLFLGFLHKESTLPAGARWIPSMVLLASLFSAWLVRRWHVRNDRTGLCNHLGAWLIAMVFGCICLGHLIGHEFGGRFSMLIGSIIGPWTGLMLYLALNASRIEWLGGVKPSSSRVMSVFTVPMLVTNAALWWWLWK
jgi:tRNA A-37 threonylcarbamoyl transferase component Bud32